MEDEYQPGPSLNIWVPDQISEIGTCHKMLIVAEKRWNSNWDLSSGLISVHRGLKAEPDKRFIRHLPPQHSHFWSFPFVHILDKIVIVCLVYKYYIDNFSIQSPSSGRRHYNFTPPSLLYLYLIVTSGQCWFHKEFMWSFERDCCEFCFKAVAGLCRESIWPWTICSLGVCVYAHIRLWMYVCGGWKTTLGVRP